MPVKKKYPIVLLLFGCGIGCADQDCYSFLSQDTVFCIPKENVLGSIWFLERVGKNEIGFQMGEVGDAGLITVTLTRKDYFCRKNEGSRFCRPHTVNEHEDQGTRDVVRVYLNEQRSFWDYQVAGAENGHPVANCSSIPDQPNGGRCISAGIYKDIVYSAIFLDTRAGGVLQARKDVEQQIRRWEIQVR